MYCSGGKLEGHEHRKAQGSSPGLLSTKTDNPARATQALVNVSLRQASWETSSTREDLRLIQSLCRKNPISRD